MPNRTVSNVVKLMLIGGTIAVVVNYFLEPSLRDLLKYRSK